MDKLSSMRVFARVAQAGSFARAAEQLGMSRAMVTKHVISLENTLGTRLLNRTTRKLSLTEVGRAYRDRCVQILAEVEEAEFGSYHLGPAAADFMELYPEVEVMLTLNDRMADLAEEGFDLAIRIARVPDANLIAQKLAHARMAVCGSPRYFEKHGIPKHPEDLRHHNCLRYTYRVVNEWEFNTPDGKIAVPVHGTLESNIGDALRMAAMQGLGLVLQPTYMVGHDIKAGRLLPVLMDYEPVGVDINAMYLHRRHLSAKVRTFVDFLKRRYQPVPYWDDWKEVLARNKLLNGGRSKQTPRRASRRR